MSDLHVLVVTLAVLGAALIVIRIRRLKRKAAQRFDVNDVHRRHGC